MVNTISGHGHGQGNQVRVFPKSEPSQSVEGATEPVQQQNHPGRGKAGAPGQLAKQMLGGTPPAGFALGNLVSLIAHGDMDGAQNLVNELTPPAVEEPAADSADVPIAEEGVAEVVVAPLDSPEEEGAISEPVVTEPESVSVESEETVAEEITDETAILLTPETDGDPSILDLFEVSEDAEEAT
ncbi:MAG: hypothetical protein JKX94_01545 [Sneathiella sp.]|nr:hypothetical protein [Sneathiella sp.]